MKIFLSGSLEPIQFLYFHALARAQVFFSPAPKQARDLLLCIAAAAAIFLSTHVGFKILSDESNVLSVANMLALFRKASNTEMWTFYYGTYHPVDLQVPKRPILFSFLVSLAHQFTGMRPANVFAVNFALLSALFYLALGWAKRAVSPDLWFDLVVLAILMMSPALSICATSGGYDLTSLVCGFACFRLLLLYGAQPDSTSFAALFYGVIVFAWTRYECIVALPILLAYLFFKEGITAVAKKLAWYQWLAGACLFLPLLLQEFLTWGTLENPPGVPGFSLAHAVKHLPIFLRLFFLEFTGPYPVLLHWLGLAQIFWLCSMRLSSASVVMCTYLTFLLALLLSHYLGDPSHPVAMRLFLPLSFSLSIMAIPVFYEFLRRFRLPFAFVLVATLLQLRAYTLSDPMTTALTLAREYRYLQKYLADEGKKEFLFIYERPILLTALGYSAVSWQEFQESKDDYLIDLRRGLFQKIIALERMPTQGERLPLQEETLLGLKVEELYRLQTSAKEDLHISRVSLEK